MAKSSRVVEQVVSRYHRAIEKRDADTAFACLGRQYFQIVHKPGRAADPSRWGGGRLPANAKAVLRKWVKDLTYKNTIEFMHTNIEDNFAVVVAKETGGYSSPKGEGHTWKGVTNIWCLSKTNSTWKIISSIHYAT